MTMHYSSAIFIGLFFLFSNVYANKEDTLIYFQDFDQFPDGTKELNDGSVLAEAAVVIDGKLQISKKQPGQNASIWIPPTEISVDGWVAQFDYEISSNRSGPPPADGFSFNYGAIPPGEISLFAEEGFFPDFSPSISFEMDTWLNDTEEVGPAIAVDGIDIPGGFINGNILNAGQTISGTIVISMEPDGSVSFNSTGALTNANFDNLKSQFDLSADFSFVLAARTGGASQEVLVDNLRISALEEPAQTLEEILQIYVKNETLVLEIPSAARRTIGVEYSPDLSKGSWIELGNFFPIDNGISRFTDPDTGRTRGPGGYYRAFLRPIIRE